jgi:hypothetical protein
MPNLVKGQDSVTPSSFVLDFNTMPPAYQHAGPFWLSLDYWLMVDDAAAGSMQVQIDYIDPTGAMQSIVTGGMSLAALPSRTTPVPVQLVQRQSASSLWTATFVLGGIAGASKFSWRIMHGPASPLELVGW